MKPSIVRLICVAGILALSFADDPFVALRKLRGTWIMKTKNGGLGETWSIKSDEEIFGKGFMIRGMDTVLLETVTLIKRPNGIFYESLVKGQNDGRAIHFRLVSYDESRFEFENKEHDYPTTITYTLVKEDSLVARIEGVKNGKTKSSEFRYRKMSAAPR